MYALNKLLFWFYGSNSKTFIQNDDEEVNLLEMFGWNYAVEAPRWSATDAFWRTIASGKQTQK